jgi:hypothetical protein
MNRKFKFLGHTEINEAGEKVKTGKNFGARGRIEPGAIITAASDAEASAFDDHDEFEEVTDKKATKAEPTAIPAGK